MKVKFAGSFFKSLKSLNMRYKWYLKPWFFLNEDVPRFVKNVWLFRKALSNHYWWDYRGSLIFLQTAFNHMADNVEKKGLEIDETRLKKVERMRRAAQILTNHSDDLFIDLAEKELGEIISGKVEFVPCEDHPEHFRMKDDLNEEQNQHNLRVYKLSRKIENDEWDELIEILRGQDYKKFKSDVDFNKQFDGSGLKNWWD